LVCDEVELGTKYQHPKFKNYQCNDIDGNLLLNKLVIYTYHVWIVRYCSTRLQLDHPQTIVLVGHGLGGLVLKIFTMEVDKVSKVDKANGELQKARCKAFQQNIKGIVFYSVPHTTFEEECAKYWTSYPSNLMSLLHRHFPTKQVSQNMVLVNERFEKSIEQQHINLFAFVEGQKVQSCGYLSSFGGFSSLGQSLVS